MPNFTGHTVENVGSDFDEDRVDIVSIQHVGMGQEQPNTPGAFPPNMYKNITSGAGAYDASKFEVKYGLHCFEQNETNKNFSKQMCYGLRDINKNEFILLNIMIPPYADWIQFPIMQAVYFSPQYGGIEIIWRANMKHFPRWQEIDSQIWKFLDAWNVAPKQPNK